MKFDIKIINQPKTELVEFALICARNYVCSVFMDIM